LQDQNALCYQSSTSAGDACCASNGTAYPNSGSKFPIPPAPGGKNNTTPGVPAVISKGDGQCNCTTPQHSTHPPIPPYPSSSVNPVKSSPPVPPPAHPPSSTTPAGAIVSSTRPSSPYIPHSTGYPMLPSSSIKSSSSYTSSQLPSNWSPTPSPTPTTTTSSSAKAPIYVGAAMVHTVGAEVFAVAGLAALLL
jgi:hypothetical protein